MRGLCTIALALIGVAVQVIPCSASEPYKIRTVVIDAGHGGHDAGCLGASSQEKHVALDIALKLGKQIENNYPDIKVVYTRKTDVFIPLHERAQIANKANAELFICIHLNSGGKPAFGAETYVMGNHKSADNLLVAKRENDVVQLEDDYLKKYDGFDPNSPEADIIFTLYQSRFMAQSLMFASNVQDEFSVYAGRHDRGVKQAGFLVLYKTAMPSVLIECGFLTHDKEEKFLASDKGQNLMATAIYRAFKAYKIDMESGKQIPESEAPVQPQATPKTQPGPPVAATQTAPLTDKASNPGTANPNPLSTAPSDPVKKTDNQKLTPALVDSANKQTAVLPSSSSSPSPASPAVFIAVQIGASKDPANDDAKYLKRKDVSAVRCDDGYTRYLIGRFTDEQEARKKLSQVKSGGLPDAFLTAIDGKRRIPVAEALSKLTP
ncbi:MAG: N-acetylmuramoyl-L-alanine amidase [Bacteroidota bacterium]